MYFRDPGFNQNAALDSRKGKDIFTASGILQLLGNYFGNSGNHTFKQQTKRGLLSRQEPFTAVQTKL